MTNRGRGIAWLMAGLLMGACASQPPEENEAGVEGKHAQPGEPDALAAITGNGGARPGTPQRPSGPGYPAPPDAAIPVPAPPSPATCAPGARLDLCSICGPEGQAQVADDDDACPPVDCAGLDAYERGVEGDDQVCWISRHRGAGGRCSAIGVCRGAGDPQFCADVVRAEVSRTQGPCQLVEGCTGSTPPTLVEAEFGTPCGEALACNADGQCAPIEIDEQCEPFVDQRTCGSDVSWDGISYCTVSTEGTPNVHCMDYCSGMSGICLAAWISTGPSPCNRSEEAGCLQVAERLLCGCGLR